MMPSANRPLSELLADRAKEFERKAAHHAAKGGVEIPVGAPGPYAIAFFGDAHVDDPGCDIALLCDSMKLVAATDGVYAVNIGDLTNNWIGSLARLYAHQTATDDEAIMLATDLLTAIPWSFVILGNHDTWGPVAKLICQHHGIPYAAHGAMLTFVSPTGHRLVVDARHDHPGRSMWNPAHAQLRRNAMGSPADIIVAGHTHQSATVTRKSPMSGKLAHCIRVCAFKRFDEYADSKHLPDEAISPIVLAVVDPFAKSAAGVVKVHEDLERGLVELDALRRYRCRSESESN